MTKAGLNLPGFAEAVEHARNLGVLWSRMIGFFNAAGFGGIGYSVFSRAQPGEVSLLLVDGFPASLQQGFIDLGYARHDPNFRYALATGHPSLRSRICDSTTLSPEEARHHVAREALDYGDTLALPVFGPQNYVGIISIGMAVEPGLFERVSWPMLHMAAMSAHLRARIFQNGEAAPHTLSEREVEVLGWVAQGKSNGVIADILSIATATVDTYLRRIFEKLQVADRTSAAVKAVSLGLIRV